MRELASNNSITSFDKFVVQVQKLFAYTLAFRCQRTRAFLYIIGLYEAIRANFSKKQL